MTNADFIVDQAIRHLDTAEALLRQIKLATTAITVHWIDVARRHAEMTRGDAKREVAP